MLILYIDNVIDCYNCLFCRYFQNLLRFVKKQKMFSINKKLFEFIIV